MAARLRAQEARNVRAAELSAMRQGGPYVQAAPMPSPVSAYAPVRQDFANGRGLY
jgi:hypothetical protein